MQKKSRSKIIYNKATSVGFLQSGEGYFSALLDIIENAKKLILLQVYTLDPDDTGSLIMDALKRAVHRKVEVYVLVDAYGSRALAKKGIVEMRNAGIHCRRFSPILFLKFRAGRRLHHKITVADAETALIGGINISDKYRGDKNNLAWIDFAIQIAGPVAVDLQKLCEKMYYPDRISSPIKRTRNNPTIGEYPASVAHSDWFRKRNRINYHFKVAIRDARKDIIILCSYFLPSFRLISLLKSASRRGIEVQLYLQGKSDLPVVRDATRFLYRIFFKTSIKIFEFPERVLHGKLWIIDDEIINLGSYNFNHLSEFTSVETNIEIAHTEFCKKAKKDLKVIFDKYAHPVRAEVYLKKLKLWQRFRLWASYNVTLLLMRLAFAFTTRSS